MPEELQRAISIPEPTNNVDSLWSSVKALKEAVEMIQGIRGNREYALLSDVLTRANDLEQQILAIDITGGTGATELNELTDVNTSTPTDRNVLVADGVDFESRPLVEADISDLQHADGDLNAADDEVITGDWEFQTDVSANEALTIYNPDATSGLKWGFGGGEPGINDDDLLLSSDVSAFGANIEVAFRRGAAVAFSQSAAVGDNQSFQSLTSAALAYYMPYDATGVHQGIISFRSAGGTGQASQFAIESYNYGDSGLQLHRVVYHRVDADYTIHSDFQGNVNVAGVVTIDVSGINLVLNDAGEVDLYSPGQVEGTRLWQNNADFQIQGVNTVNLDITGFTDMRMNGGFVVINGSSALAIRSDGTDINFTHASTTNWNITGITSIQAGTVDADFDVITATHGGIPSAINTQNGNYTLVLADAGKTIRKATGGAGETITIPANGSVAYSIGTFLGVLNEGGGDLTVAITTDTLQNLQKQTTGSQTLPTGHLAVLQKVTATLWKYASTDFIPTSTPSPINVQDGNYTMVIDDAGKTMRKESGAAGETYTIPAEGSVGYVLGTFLGFDNEGGGDLDIAITTDTLIWAEDGTTGTRTLGDSGYAIAQKVATGPAVWKIAGSQLS